MAIGSKYLEVSHNCSFDPFPTPSKFVNELNWCDELNQINQTEKTEERTNQDETDVIRTK